MKPKAINLAWIVVKDFKRAIEFYTKVVGLKIKDYNEEWGWAELEGHDGSGMILGIAKESPDGSCPVQPGQNAVITLTVDNIESACKDLQKQGAKLIGKIEEVPGHVKMQSVQDSDGNNFQIVQILSMEQHQQDHHKHDHSKGCCSGH